MTKTNLPIWGQQAGQYLKLDCRHYLGDRPCKAGVQGVCPSSCSHYAPMGHRIVIIKLGALGDVIRTAAILPALKEQWPTSHITWISKPSGVRMLANHPLIDRLLPFDAETICHVEHERFDLCLSLDKEPGPTALAMRIDAKEHRGVGLSPHGTTYPLNPECVDYFVLGLDDEQKFHKNTKSYQQLLFDALGLEYRQHRYRLYPSETQREWASSFWQGLEVGEDDIVIGFNTGAGNVFANKSWPPRKFIELAQKIHDNTNWKVALFGGPGEKKLNQQIAVGCKGVINTGNHHAELDFAALIARCNTIITGDTMAMHVAIAQDVPTIVLFGPTCHQEIDVYNCGQKFATTMPCAPCYKRSCDKIPNCMDGISVDAVLSAVKRWVSASQNESTPLPVLEGTR